MNEIRSKYRAFNHHCADFLDQWLIGLSDPTKIQPHFIADSFQESLEYLMLILQERGCLSERDINTDSYEAIAILFCHKLLGASDSSESTIALYESVRKRLETEQSAKALHFWKAYFLAFLVKSKDSARKVLATQDWKAAIIEYAISHAIGKSRVKDNITLPKVRHSSVRRVTFDKRRKQHGI